MTEREHTYAENWVNESDTAFKLFLAEIHPKDAGTVPPDGFVLKSGEHHPLHWKIPPPNGEANVYGYIRWWLEPSSGAPGSGLTFGVKVEQRFNVKGEPEPRRIFTYYGSPTGNPNSWEDITDKFAGEVYTTSIEGEHKRRYEVTISFTFGPSVAVTVTIQNEKPKDA